VRCSAGTSLLWSIESAAAPRIVCWQCLLCMLVCPKRPALSCGPIRLGSTQILGTTAALGEANKAAMHNPSELMPVSFNVQVMQHPLAG